MGRQLGAVAHDGKTFATPSFVPLRWARSLEIAVGYSPALAFAIFAAGSGLPALRHDWLCIPNRADFLRFTLASLVWLPNGIGAPRAYPTDYLLALGNAAVVFVAGPHVAFAVFVFCVGAICVLGARSLTALASDDAWICFGLATFAVFNPWVYTKLVAGHLAMIGAYGATMCLFAEGLRAKPHGTRAALFMCIIVAQIQFFLIALIFALWIAVFRRRTLPLWTGLVVALPTIAGLAANIGAVANTPYTLAWQSSQSLRPIDAAALTGYFAHYTQGFAPLAFDAVWAMLALAMIGAVTAPQRLRVAGFMALAIVAWAWSTGLDGPVANGYSWAILHAPALEIFRELYDLLAYVAIGYIALAAMAGRLHPLVGKLTVLPGIVLALTWLAMPPSRWWVSLSQIPQIRVDAPDHTRIAFMPDVAPMTLRGRGSGIDPDTYARAGDVTPLNGDQSVFPAGVALRRFAETADASELSHLGVSRIYFRPWLSTDVASVGPQLALPAKFPPLAVKDAVTLHPSPELALVSHLNVMTLPPPIGSEALFFGDVAGMSGDGVPRTWAALPAPMKIVPSGREIQAALGWVDVRQAFLARPELAQGLGGVMTTSATAMLDVQKKTGALVWVRGVLLGADGSTLFRGAGGYRWIDIPETVKAVRCNGECVVALQGRLPRGIGSTVDPGRVTAVPFRAVVPWLANATVPASQTPALLRYAVGYDAHWLAITSRGFLPHLRVESALNGWVIPEHERLRHVLIIEYIAAIQLLFECLGVAWTLALLFRLARAPAQ